MGMRVASPRTRRIERSSPSAATLPRPRRSIAPAKSTPDDRCAGYARTRRDREIGRPRTQVQHARAGGQLQRLDGALAPSTIESGAQHAIEEVVSWRDRVEHRRRCGRRLVDRCGMGVDRCLIPSTPDRARAEAERRENLPRHEVREIFQRLRHLVEGRHRRHDHRAGFGAQHHVAQLRQAHRRLPRDQDQAAVLLEHDVSRTLDQVAREPVRDAGQRLHRARHDTIESQSWLPLAILAPRSLLL